MIGIAVAAASFALPRAASTPVAASASPARSATVGAAASGVAAVRSLAMPAGITEAQLMVMPDRYVNESLPAPFRIPLTIRGVSGLASAEPPSAILWTEGGLSYLLTSRSLSIPQLVDLAAALR